MSAMIRLMFILLFFTWCIPGSGQSGFWQQAMKYTIEVSLDDKEHSITGNMTLFYQNNSPDTLDHIWFQVWPNAFKNDRTAFSEQQLKLGKTDFYFSKPGDRGYINKLDFRAGNTSLEMEDHPNYIDLVRVNLAAPLLPGTGVTITTSYYVKLPLNTGSLGHSGRGGQFYQLVDWYPKASVYDETGWHHNPYLEQGRSYSEYCSFDVKITLPANYLVAATGVLQNAEEVEWLYTRNKPAGGPPVKQPVNKKSFGKPVPRPKTVQSDNRTKTLHYTCDKANDFALFADKHFWLDTGSVVLPSGKKVLIWKFMQPDRQLHVSESSVDRWASSLYFNAELLGDYPYPVLSVVPSGAEQDQLYPGLCLTGTSFKETNTETQRLTTAAWFDPTASATPWLMEGLNTWLSSYYTYITDPAHDPDYYSYFRDNIPLNERRIEQQAAERQQSDQPITTSPDSSSPNNFRLAKYKTADWLRMMEERVGKESFLKTLKAYSLYSRYRLTDVKDFKALLQQYSDTDIDTLFALLNQTGSLAPLKVKAGIQPVFLYDRHPSVLTRKIILTPVPGYNSADGLMIGAGIHNYGRKYYPFRIFLSPLFAIRSKQVNGIADLAYTHHAVNRKHSYRLGSGFSRFSTLSGTDSNGTRISAGFIKYTPSVRMNFHSADPFSLVEKFIEWKTYIIGESGFTYKQKQADLEFYPLKTVTQYRYINQLSLSVMDPRVLYPYYGSLQLQQASDFYRVNLDAGYFFNYAKGGGVDIRLFAAKFGYLGENTVASKFATQRFQPKLTAVRGDEDYTYSNYFAGRHETDGFASQQIMMRDGALKIRTDIFQDLQGRSDDWVTAMNFSTTIPSSILPPAIPLKLFFDIGTYAGAWKESASGSRFLYVGGLQLSLFHKLLNVYAPVIYSKAYSDALKTVPEENKFLRKISFSIDLHTLHAKRIMKKYHAVY